MNRSHFIKQSIQLTALLLMQPLPGLLAQSPFPKNNNDKDLLERLIAANDEQVDALLKTDFENRTFSRRVGNDFTVLAASYCSPGSKHYESDGLLQAMEKLSQHLLNAQASDGTVNVGNLESPPDTAFVIEVVAAAATVLYKQPSPLLNDVKANLKNFLLKSGEGLVTGGVHTANHRWVVSAALAKLNAIFPNRKYVQRINEWLSEGVYINADGNYPERSRIYSMVESNAFITIGHLTNKPSLFKVVRKNLETTYYYTQPNGELVTNDSRRQDQYPFRPDALVTLSIVNYYLLYRHMAIKENNGFFAAVVKMIEALPEFENRILRRSLIYFLEEPILQNDLPASTTLPVNYEKLFAQSHLLRIRRNDTSITLFGGTDQPITVASGRSNSPDFFSYHKGEAILDYMRLSTSFFDTGYFYSEGVEKQKGKYVLHKELKAPYYQPLPKNLRQAGGDYKLSESTDGRFWNKMDFKNRPASNVKTLGTTITLTETNGAVQLLFDVKGQRGVEVTIELCFRKGGKLSAMMKDEKGNMYLKEGMATYSYGKDVIEFGNGSFKHQNVNELEGERYSTHFGSLRTDGMHVYITGVTPFVHTLKFS